MQSLTSLTVISASREIASLMEVRVAGSDSGPCSGQAVTNRGCGCCGPVRVRACACVCAAGCVCCVCAVCVLLFVCAVCVCCVCVLCVCCVALSLASWPFVRVSYYLEEVAVPTEHLLAAVASQGQEAVAGVCHLLMRRSSRILNGMHDYQGTHTCLQSGGSVGTAAAAGGGPESLAASGWR